MVSVTFIKSIEKQRTNERREIGLQKVNTVNDCKKQRKEKKILVYKKKVLNRKRLQSATNSKKFIIFGVQTSSMLLF